VQTTEKKFVSSASWISGARSYVRRLLSVLADQLGCNPAAPNGGNSATVERLSGHRLQN
jgi:hypothetical protein